MNIMFTTYCNQKCSYCFGQDAMSVEGQRRSDREISRENLRFVIDFIRRSGGGHISVIGGEPTLHSQFQRRYEQIERAGLSVQLFSNCVMDQETAMFLGRKASLENILLNIREPWEYSSGDWKKLRRTLKYIKKVTLSFRIYRLGFNLRFLFDLIDEFGLERSINFAPALPSLEAKTSYLPLTQYKRMGAEMARWSRESQKRKISWYSDAGFILCGFSRAMLRELRENVGFVPNANCCAAVEVRPNLMAQRCFGFWSKADEAPVSLKRFASEKDVHKYFDRCSMVIKQRYGALGRCGKCVHLKDKTCGGGCMIHILKQQGSLRWPHADCP